jgi:hypothetical protein
MSSLLDHQIACILATRFVALSPIVSDLGTISLHSDGDGARHFLARLTDDAGRVSSYVVHLTVGGVR